MTRTTNFNLMDKLIDEAEELARNQVMSPDASDFEILEMICECVGLDCTLSENSVGGMQALAAYNRYNIEKAVAA